MPSPTRPDAPRHLAGRGSTRPAVLRPVPAPRTALGPDDAEAAPVARVHRSRLAVALAMTVAAVPILVLDNFPATADTSEDMAVTTTAELEATPSSQPSTTTSTTGAPTIAVVLATIETTTTTPAPTTSTTAAPARTVATTPPTTAAPAPPPPKPGDPNDPATWDRMALCEAGGDWSANTGNGYYGGLQFSLSTWESYGGAGYPHEATKATQIEVARRLHAARGWDAWPSCAQELGFR